MDRLSHQKIDQLEDVKIPNINATRDEAMEDEAMDEDMGRTDSRASQTEIPLSGSGVQPPTRGT